LPSTILATIKHDIGRFATVVAAKERKLNLLYLLGTGQATEKRYSAISADTGPSTPTSK
jgi:NADH:ubiquinone oxidoreductase subunit B-like Fe-S oxidoreductase